MSYTLESSLAMHEHWAMIDRYGAEDPINIFYLDHDPEAAARAHCNTHVVKMIVETAQLLSTAWHLTAPDAVESTIFGNDPMYPYEVGLRTLGPGMAYYLAGQRIYAATHPHHPSSVWTSACTGNYDWLWQLGQCLLEEYTFRYKRQHATTHVLRTLEARPPLPIGDQTEPPAAMPEEFIVTSREGVEAVDSYRAYYLGAKRQLLTYTRRQPPRWAPVATFKPE